MSDSIDIKFLTGKAQEIAQNNDKYDINGNNTPDSKLSGAEISVFLADCEKEGINIEKEPWYAQFANIIEDVKNNFVTKNISFQAIDKMYQEVATIKIPDKKVPQENQDEKAILSEKLCNKWGCKYQKSPLNKSFYEKLYDIIDTLNITIDDNKWDKEKYSSLKAQVMDEVVAIFAAESGLKPKAKNGIYNGLFQLAAPGMSDLKRWAKKHPDVKEVNNIKSSMTMNGFRQLSGNEQLDYLVAYVGYAKEYSNIKTNESITPAQLWSLIKKPSKGKDNKMIKSKTDSINNVLN